MAAFVAAFIAQATDRSARRAAMIGDLYPRHFWPIVAAIIALAGVSALAATAGALMAPILTPNARLLLLAAALLSAGVGGLTLGKVRTRPGDWRLGGFTTTLAAMLALGLGDRTQLVTAALAARGSLPGFAAIGATLGSLAVVIPAMQLGERRYLALPLRPFGIATGIVMILLGIGLGLTALRLI